MGSVVLGFSARRLVVVAGQRAALAREPEHGAGGIGGGLPGGQEQADRRADQRHRQDELEPPTEDR